MEQAFLTQCVALKPFFEQVALEPLRQQQVDGLSRMLDAMAHVKDPAVIVSTIIGLGLSQELQGSLIAKVTSIAAA